MKDREIKFRRSKQGVPHILITEEGITYSICYMGKGEFWRVWEYGSQKRIKDIYLPKGGLVDFKEMINVWKQKQLWT